MKNDCCTVCGEIAISVAAAFLISGTIRFIATNCATQNGHQRPRKKQIIRVLRSKKRHSHCDLPIQTEDISRPREERDLGFFAVATPQWRAHAPPAHPAAHTSQ